MLWIPIIPDEDRLFSCTVKNNAQTIFHHVKLTNKMNIVSKIKMNVISLDSSASANVAVIKMRS